MRKCLDLTYSGKWGMRRRADAAAKTFPGVKQHTSSVHNADAVARPSAASITAHRAEGPVSPRRNRIVGRSFVKIQVIVLAAGIALVSTYAFAEPMQPSLGGVVPSAKINGIVRSMGLMPTGQPVRQGHIYVVLATSRQGKSVRIIVDARSGKVLSVQRVIAVIPPGPYSVRQPVGAAVPRPYAPDEISTPGARLPRPIGETQPPAVKPDKPEQKSTTTPASPNPPVVTIGVSSTNPAADPKPTGSKSGSPSFPPVQSFE